MLTVPADFILNSHPEIGIGRNGCSGNDGEASEALLAVEVTEAGGGGMLPTGNILFSAAAFVLSCAYECGELHGCDGCIVGWWVGEEAGVW